MAFTAPDALHDGYEVYPVVDAIAGTSPEAHRAGLERVTQAGGQPVSWVSLACGRSATGSRNESVTCRAFRLRPDRPPSARPSSA